MNDNKMMFLMNNLNFYKSKDGLYATIIYDDRKKNVSVTSNEFGNYITAKYFKEYNDFPDEREIKNCLKVVEYNLQNTNNIDELFSQRYVWKDEAILIDIANDELQYVKVTDETYDIVECDDDEAIFVKNSMSLPMQVMSIEDADSTVLFEGLETIVNLTENDLFLYKIWLIASMHPKINTPLLCFVGGAGTGKSSMQKLASDLLDPSLRGLVNWDDTSTKEIAIALNNSYVINCDNVSKITQKRSDLLCQSITGGNISVRKLYSDSDEITYDLKTRITISCVENCIMREDLATRTLFMNVPSFIAKRRIQENEFVKIYEEKKAYFLSDMLMVLSIALSRYDEWKQNHYSYHRLASFEIFGSLIADILDTEYGYERFRKIMKRKHLQQMFLDEQDAAFISCMFEVLDSEYEGEYNGGTKRLYNYVSEYISEDPECEFDESVIMNYDRFAKLLHAKKEAFPTMGYEIEFGKRTKDNTSSIKLQKIEDANTI